MDSAKVDALEDNEENQVSPNARFQNLRLNTSEFLARKHGLAYWLQGINSSQLMHMKVKKEKK